MLFQSLDFAVFLPVVFATYWALGRSTLRVQNLFLVLASYLFYGWWDFRFLGLIVFSSLVDFGVGRALARSEGEGARRALVGLSLATNLGLLAYFKYANFFLANLDAAFSFLGQPLELRALSIVLPVGISFYTFQTLSYTLDVYRRKVAPTDDLIGFLAYVSFFPQLVAGPIERATQLLPQFAERRVFAPDAARDGLRRILWGLFKKVVIADTCAPHVNAIFAQPDVLGGAVLLWGAVLFAFQIYGDFSGYSDIAIGTARLFGFDLMTNFRTPYFSRSIAEFWRRWHISLSTWFRDYLYIPLGGSRGGLGVTVRNTFAIFLVSGFWHGANWTFIAWGLLHALFFLPSLVAGRNRRHLDDVAAGRWLPSAGEALQMASTFALVTLAWVFFRAESVTAAVAYLGGISRGGFGGAYPALVVQGLLILVLLAFEWPTRDQPHPLARLPWPRPARWALYALMAQAIVMFTGSSANDFIYFQF